MTNFVYVAGMATSDISLKRIRELQDIKKQHSGSYPTDSARGCNVVSDTIT